jgi:L-lactate dehydrogenase (cytochrome)
VAGEAGVRKGIALLRDEVSRNLAMLGVSSPADVGCDCLVDGQGVTSSA